MGESLIPKIRDWGKRLSQKSILRSAALLITGTAAAQALTVVALPILTRIYTPNDFNALALYIAITSVIGSIACLRFESTVPLPKEDDEAKNLLCLAVISCIATTTATLSIVAILALYHNAWKPYEKLGASIWLIPAGVLAMGLYAAAQSWTTRKKRFKDLARTKVTQAVYSTISQLALGALGAGSLGLIGGQIINSGAGSLQLARQALRIDEKAFATPTRAGMRAAAKTYRQFPTYSVLDTLANNAAAQVPILIIAAIAVGPEAGFLMLAMRALGTPVALIGGATAQVFLSKAPEEFRHGTLYQFALSTAKGLALLGFPVLAVAALIAPLIFPIIFGEGWLRSGELIVWMAPWFFLKLIASPISMVMHVAMAQKRLLILTIGGLLLRVGGVVCAPAFGGHVAEAYAVTSGLFYLVALLLFLWTAKTAAPPKPIPES